MSGEARKKGEKLKGQILDALPASLYRLRCQFRKVHPDLIPWALMELENEGKIKFSGDKKEWQRCRTKKGIRVHG